MLTFRLNTIEKQRRYCNVWFIYIRLTYKLLVVDHTFHELVEYLTYQKPHCTKPRVSHPILIHVEILLLECQNRPWTWNHSVEYEYEYVNSARMNTRPRAEFIFLARSTVTAAYCFLPMAIEALLSTTAEDSVIRK